MAPMNSIERKLKILELLNSEDSVKITRLTDLFDISRVTVREDLDELAEKGLLVRTRGGAMHLENIPAIKLLSDSIKSLQSEKKLICTEAVKLIAPRMTIIIDGGSTLMYLARFVSQMNVTVITNSFLVLEELKNSQTVQVFVVGGTLQRQHMALIDSITSFVFEQVHADILFMGAPGYAIDKGITARTILDAEIKKQMIKSASQVCLVADSTKNNKMFMANICGWDAIDFFITDKISKKDQRYLAQRGVKVMLPSS
jgi:DeoR family fructose operon transcriptional repressor